MAIMPPVSYPFEAEDRERVSNVFTYHPPNDEQQVRYVDIRAKAKEFAEMIYFSCPSSRERSLALTKLEEVVMWANASIARNEGG